LNICSRKIINHKIRHRIERQKYQFYASYLSSRRAELEAERKSTDLMSRSQRSACLSSSDIFSDGVKPPFVGGCSNRAINSDTEIQA